MLVVESEQGGLDKARVHLLHDVRGGLAAIRMIAQAMEVELSQHPQARKLRLTFEPYLGRLVRQVDALHPRLKLLRPIDPTPVAALSVELLLSGVLFEARGAQAGLPPGLTIEGPLMVRASSAAVGRALLGAWLAVEGAAGRVSALRAEAGQGVVVITLAAPLPSEGAAAEAALAAIRRDPAAALAAGLLHDVGGTLRFDAEGGQLLALVQLPGVSQGC